ncbi:EAL domain-containing protein [Alteromonas sp. D210916BOD_24]|uniref:EAL and HDOD domain-containing protein n=1 Tax=Alteromonas sp. D210916BOD_24 TaxID=3157618 RepID=UPI00399D35A7
MKVFTARQAIFNRRQQTVAYEVFFRDGIENVFPKDVDPNVATSRLIVNQHLNVGISTLTNGKRALINFSQQGLIDRVPALLPPNDIVIEVLEDVEPTDEVYQACRELFHKGYRMALDDFLYHRKWDRFINFTRLLKFDIQNTPLDEIAPLVEKFKQRKGLKLLAEKVETPEEFAIAKKMGFDFFQGYFFAKPEMIQNKDIEAQHAMILIIYHEALKPYLNYTKLARYFEQDVSLSYKLLRFTNSGLFVLREPIESIKQALVYLGEEQARKFVCLIATAHLNKNKPLEIIRVSIIRARFCEQIAKQVVPQLADSAFMVGLFSMIDALLDSPMEALLAKLPLSDDIKTALLGEKTILFFILELVKAYESGSWWAITKKANTVGIVQEELPDMHRNATLWSETYESIK